MSEGSDLPDRIASSPCEDRCALVGFAAAEQFARALLPHVPHAAVFIFDRDFTLCFADGPALKRGGYDTTALIGRGLGDVLPAPAWELLKPRYATVLAGDASVFRYDSPIQGRSYEVHGSPISAPDGTVVGALVVSHEEVTQAEQRLTARLQQQFAVAELGRLAISGAVFGDLANHAGRSIRRTLEAADGAVITELVPGGSDFLVRFDSTGRLTGNRVPLAGSMTQFVLESQTALVVPDVEAAGLQVFEPLQQLGVRSGMCVPIGPVDAPVGVFGVFCRKPFDFTGDDVAFIESLANVLAEAARREQIDADLRRQAMHDPVTGLPNRSLLDDRLRQSLAIANRAGVQVGVLFVDLDRFKVINDSLGHEGGDHVLRAVAQRLCAAVRGSDTVARFGGDEFVIVAAALTSERDAIAIAEKVMALMAAPVLIDGKEIYVRASVGIRVASSGDDVDPRTLLRVADAAMCRAKARGRGRYELADSTTGVEAPADELGVEQELRDALAAGDLQLVYQPFVQLADGSPIGAEVLLRWQHPTKGYLTPGRFLDVAEDSGLMVPIGAWMLEEACREAVRWQQQNADFLLSINLSGSQLVDPGLVDTVERALGVSGLEPRSLGLELTEQVLIVDEDDALHTLSALKELGVTLLLDDFGTGFSSLSHLKRFPVDIVKIDRSFIEGLDDPAGGGDDAAIVAALVGMCRATGKEIIPEGIETEAQVGELQRLGCRFGQGYHFSRPLKPDAFDAWVAKRVGRTAHRRRADVRH